MVRSILGFALFAIIAFLAINVFGAIVGGLIGIVFKVLWLAFVGWLIYLVLKLFAPETAANIRRTFTGKSA